MILQVLHCPHCHGTAIVRHGQTRQGKQRYRCCEQRCAGCTFLLDSSYPGQSPAVKQQIVGMALNARSIRNTARVLHMHEHRHDSITKKAPDLHQGNHAVLQVVQPEYVPVERCRSEELERRGGRTSALDAMWGYVRRNAHPRWWWHAIDHHTGKVLADVFGRRQDTV